MGSVDGIFHSICVSNKTLLLTGQIMENRRILTNGNADDTLFQVVVNAWGRESISYVYFHKGYK